MTRSICNHKPRGILAVTPRHSHPLLQMLQIYLTAGLSRIIGRPVTQTPCRTRRRQLPSTQMQQHGACSGIHTTVDIIIGTRPRENRDGRSHLSSPYPRPVLKSKCAGCAASACRRRHCLIFFFCSFLLVTRCGSRDHPLKSCKGDILSYLSEALFGGCLSLLKRIGMRHLEEVKIENILSCVVKG